MKDIKTGKISIFYLNFQPLSQESQVKVQEESSVVDYGNFEQAANSKIIRHHQMWACISSQIWFKTICFSMHVLLLLSWVISQHNSKGSWNKLSQIALPSNRKTKYKWAALVKKQKGYYLLLFFRNKTYIELLKQWISLLIKPWQFYNYKT